MTPDLIFLDLLNPDRFAAHNGEEHADLYVSWDALALPVQGPDAFGATAIFREPVAPAWLAVSTYEQHLRAWAQHALSRRARDQLARVVVETLLDPAWARLTGWARQHPGEPPEGVVLDAVGDWIWPAGGEGPTWEQWEDWQQMLHTAVTHPLRYARAAESDTRAALFLLRGLWGGTKGVDRHHVPCFARSPFWLDLVEIVRWIYWFAWCADQRGEFDGTLDKPNEEEGVCD